MNTYHFRKIIKNNIVPIVLGTIIILHFFNAIVLELFHDEAYYWAFSQKLAWGYFDHPPMTALWVYLGNLILPNEIGVRIVFVIFFVLGFFIFRDLLPLKHKNIGSLIYLSLIVSNGAFLALPDTPLLFFSLCYFWFFKKYLLQHNLKNAVLLAVTIACLLLSKYHGFLFIIFSLIAVPRLVKSGYFYIIVCVVIVLCLPHFLWQLENNFPTLNYHFNDRPKSSFSYIKSLEFIFLQLIGPGLLIGPFVWSRIFKRSKNDFLKAIKYCSLGIILFFAASSLNKKVEANWTSVAYPGLIIFYLSTVQNVSNILKKMVGSTLVLIIVLRIFILFPFSTKFIPRLKEVYGWKNFTKQLEIKCEKSMIANNYQIASKLWFYSGNYVHSLNFKSRNNQFDLWNNKENLILNDISYCLIWNRKKFSGQLLIDPADREQYYVTDFNLEKFLQLFPKSNL